MVVGDIALTHEFCYDLRELAVRTYNRALAASDTVQYAAMVAVLLSGRDASVAGDAYDPTTGTTGSPHLPRDFTDELRRIVYRANKIGEPYQAAIKTDLNTMYTVINAATTP